MRKLDKFNGPVPLTEAAALLSRLIGEEVFFYDIPDLCNAGWITGEIHCYARIKRLIPVLDSEGNEKKTEWGECI